MTSDVTSSYIVLEGETATLKCVLIDANPNTNIAWKWFRTDRSSDELNYGPIYIIHNTQRNMSGSYNCLASNVVGTSEAAIINVDVQCEFRFTYYINIVCYYIID